MMTETRIPQPVIRLIRTVQEATRVAAELSELGGPYSDMLAKFSGNLSQALVRCSEFQLDAMIEEEEKEGESQQVVVESAEIV